jgi:superfamily II RNA helicase
MSGIMEAWTWGATWQQLQQLCTVDDGDIARLFMRVADLLRQIQMCEHVDEELRKTAEAAHSRVYREPVRDNMM